MNGADQGTNGTAFGAGQASDCGKHPLIHLETGRPD